MKYSIEIGKIIEGSFKNDQNKIKNYTEQLIKKLQDDGDYRSAQKFKTLIENHGLNTLSPMNYNKFNNVPVDSESRTTLADVIYPHENKNKVILSKNNYDQLKSFLLCYKNADKLNTLGVGLSNTLLLYGPPGCGKTMCAHLISQELELPLVIARLDSLISSYLGTTSKNIRSLFEFVQNMPCVLFLDEFDAIAKARDDSNELGELKRVVNSLLQNIDNLSNDSLLIAATNHEQLLDAAIWRRFDYKLKVDFPDINSIKNMLDIFIDPEFNITDEEKVEISFLFQGLSGAYIEEIVKKAIRNSIIYDRVFDKKCIYEEFFIFNNIFSSNDKETLTKKIKLLRDCNPKVFSYSVISEILNISKTKVCNLLKEGDK